MTASLQLACPKCLTANRVPSDRLDEGPKCGKCGALLLDGRPVVLDEAAFNPFVARTQLPVLVDFWAPWCGPCLAMAPAFERAAGMLRTTVRCVKVDTEAAQGLAGRMGIRSIPTLVLFRNGLEAKRVSGAMDAPSLVRWASEAAGP